LAHEDDLEASAHDADVAKLLYDAVGGIPIEKLKYDAVDAKDDESAHDADFELVAQEAEPSVLDDVIALPARPAQLADVEFVLNEAEAVFGQINPPAVEAEILLDAQLDDMETFDALAQEADNTEPLSANQPPKDVTVTRYVVNELLSTNGMKSSAFIPVNPFN